METKIVGSCYLVLLGQECMEVCTTQEVALDRARNQYKGEAKIRQCAIHGQVGGN